MGTGLQKLLQTLLLAAMLLVGSAVAASAAQIKVATWNIEHLRAEANSGPNPRTDDDYQRLADYAELLNADVIALQEVDGEAAALRIFDPDDYMLFFSRRNDPMLTGFAVRRGIDVLQNPDVVALDVSGQGNLRYGTDITITVNGREIRLLSIHLKSFCSQDFLDSSPGACMTLS